MHGAGAGDDDDHQHVAHEAHGEDEGTERDGHALVQRGRSNWGWGQAGAWVLLLPTSSPTVTPEPKASPPASRPRTASPTLLLRAPTMAVGDVGVEAVCRRRGREGEEEGGLSMVLSGVETVVSSAMDRIQLQQSATDWTLSCGARVNSGS